MNDQFQIPESVSSLKVAAQKAAEDAANFAGGEASISDVLRQKVSEAYANNQDITGPLDKATTTYLSAPKVGREKYQDIFNPFTREKLVSQYVGTEALPMLSYSNIYGNRMGRVEDTLGAGVRGYQAASQTALAKAELARQSYTDALTEWKTLQDLNQEQQRINQGSGGDGGIANILATLLNPGGGGEWEDEGEVTEDTFDYSQAASYNPSAAQNLTGGMQSTQTDGFAGSYSTPPADPLFWVNQQQPAGVPQGNNFLKQIWNWIKPAQRVQPPAVNNYVPYPIK